MELIFEYIGTPSEEEIEQIPNERWKKLVKSLPKRKKKEIETLFPGVNPLGITQFFCFFDVLLVKALDLLKKFLVFNPEKRISAKDALAHPYFEGLSAEEDEVLINKYKHLMSFTKKYILIARMRALTLA